MSGWGSIIEQLAHALGNAVVQSLWQCVLVGALSAIAAMLTRRASVRYIVWCAGMLVCFVWFIATVIAGMRVDHGALPEMYAQMLGASGSGAPDFRVGVFELVAFAWACGFVAFSARFAMQWRAAHLLRSVGIVETRPEWEAMFDEVRRAIGVSARVCLRVSDRVVCPMVVGVFAPVVVVPTEVWNVMSPVQVRMVLAHELAHVRRYDHVVNMVQVMIETVMFYHPVLWWMSRQVRAEREHCCDDAAVRMCGDPVAYARALTELETVRLQTRAALGLQGGSLMKRVKRLMDGSDERRGSGSAKTLATVAAAVMIAGAAYAHTTIKSDGPREETIESVRAGVESGVMTRDQARRVFREVIFTGSELERSFEEEIVYFEAELEATNVSESDAQQKIAVVERSIDERIERAFRMQVLGMSEREADLSMFADKLDHMVEQGGMTREDAQAYYQSMLDAQVRDERVPLIKDVPVIFESRLRPIDSNDEVLILSGVDDEALRLRRDTELGSLSYYKRHIREGFLESVRKAQLAGEISELEAKRRIEVEARRQEFEARWLSIGVMYQEEVSVGRMSVDEANAHLQRAMKENGYHESVFALPERKNGMVIVAPDHVMNVWVMPEEESAVPAVELKLVPVQKEKKLTPMDDDYWIHQGIRPLDAYDESEDDC